MIKLQKKNIQTETCLRRSAPMSDLYEFHKSIRRMSEAQLCSLSKELAAGLTLASEELTTAQQKRRKLKRMLGAITRTLKEATMGYSSKTVRVSREGTEQYNLEAVLYGKVQLPSNWATSDLHIINTLGTIASVRTIEVHWDGKPIRGLRSIVGPNIYVISPKTVRTPDIRIGIELCKLGAYPTCIRLRYSSGRRKFYISKILHSYWIGVTGSDDA